jgi:hypothetical protein
MEGVGRGVNEDGGTEDEAELKPLLCCFPEENEAESSDVTRSERLELDRGGTDCSMEEAADDENEEATELDDEVETNRGA